MRPRTHSRSFRSRSSSPPNRWLGALFAMVLVGGAFASCTCDATTGEQGKACETVLADQCGGACATTNDCPDGLYCGPDRTCIADCAKGVACPHSGACDAHGECPSGAGGGGGAGAGSSTGAFVGSTGTSKQCVNLECDQVTCSGGKTTSVSGTVYEPAGKTPLYNVVVYVPNAALDPIPDGSSCDKCSSSLSGNPLVSTLTDTAGHFVLEDMPVGKDIPIVMQVGKWRRRITIDNVPKCVDTKLTDIQKTRLPKNQSEGNIPKIALSTGGADPLECFLPKIGLDLSEFTPPSGNGRVNLFHGVGGADRYDASLNAGALFDDSQNALWVDAPSLQKYDLVLLACESGQHMETKPASARQAMVDYTGAGGRVFASHYHGGWIQHGPAPFPTVATITDLADLNNITATIVQSFPKGAALADWLVNVNASSTKGQIDIVAAQHTVTLANNPPSQEWITFEDPGTGHSVQYLTFNTPIGVPDDQQCGRFVLSDLHVSSGDTIGSPFPNGCTTTTLSAQEKALLFMLFDLSSCIQNDQDPTCPPGHDACGTGLPACPGGQICSSGGCCVAKPF